MMDNLGLREAWLVAATVHLNTRLFAGALPPVKLSCGWTSRGARSDQTDAIGQCWSKATSRNGINQIFISPRLDDPPEVLAVLVHELIHAMDDCTSGHRGAFKAMALKVGLVGPMRATKAGEELAGRLMELAMELGAYPHGALTPITKQGTRMLKFSCPCCGWTGRATAKWMAEGLPTCHCGEPMIAVTTNLGKITISVAA